MPHEPADFKQPKRGQPSDHLLLLPPRNGALPGGVPGTVKRPDLMHKPGGDWNTYELILVGDKGLALINGQRAWDAAGFTRASQGHIGFQNEGFPLEVRTVKIRRLGRG